MEAVIIAAAVLTFSGVIPLLYAALNLANAARLTGDSRFILEAVALLVYAVGLIVETVGLASSVMHPGVHTPPPWARHYTQGVELGAVLQASLLAGYLYVASYAVHAGALYSGRLEPLLASILLVYAEYNMIALVFLAAICYALIEQYRASREAIAYHALICGSHVLGLIAAGIGGAALIAPPVLRGASAWLLLPMRHRG